MKTILLRSPRLPSDPFLDRAEKSAANAAASEQASAESQQAAQQSASGSAQSSQLADEARVKAETAQGKSETAQQAAETAQGKSETAQQAAETAQGKSETAQQAAEAAQGKAETAQQAAETAQSKTEQSEAAALKSATDAAGDAAVTLDQASKAIDANNAAQVAKSEAIRAKEDATAIVHNDEGSVTPGAGKYPIADSNGHLDIGWTPLLQAMYPYSGVIGSVDKGDLVSNANGGGFDTDTFWVNRVRLKRKQFNIAGRFVDFRGVDFILPEAESTAARAIAFDDIFLGWDGNIQTYRSITPHRTTTGYDRDAIATEHGYTKVQTGLYKTGDTYALLLGRVARRNKGAYHPVFNSEGCAGYGRTDQPAWSFPWNHPSADKLPTNSEMCFSFYSDGGSRSDRRDAGAISGGNENGRPDKKKFDAIYADDFTPLYYSAKNVVDRQALLFDSFNRAVAGETFSGAEGMPYGEKFRIVSFGTDYNSGWQPTGSGIETAGKLTICVDDRAAIRLLDGEVGVLYYSEGAVYVSSNHPQNNSYLSSTLFICNSSGDPAPPITIDTREPVFLRKIAASARPQFLMVDIIGSLDAMPDGWKTHGVPGNWLNVGEEGESLIPDGTSKYNKASRKCLELYQLLESSDKGVTWTDGTAWAKREFEGAANGWRGARDSNRLIMIFYRTSANPFELTGSGEVQSVSNDCLVANHYLPNNFSLYSSNLINKVPVAAAGVRVNRPAISNLPLETYIKPLLAASGSYEQVSHEPISINRDLPAVKSFVYSSGSYLHVIYKELKHNGTSWGDDNKFNIVDKQSTVTDLNGEKVIIGQKRVELPYHFDGETY
ncbi:hypothetical protein [Endozoicomonas acroporae]|uniref:hypothetical protein n=1 Tax=Endozoicomonas acroporae TaxID=1701104 RepID=UPI0013D8544A|nr:hypothetical protein [Endozoicomonas acroporae]